ncbi:hypothetical protein [Streptomyces sp. AC627_RSS907]|uniref:hypothetical protein n=1 Tax=Streptomyces sp. AC627_RSS907 TaxID=2823684 RepID=UPI001C23C95E|nr:hypothetical protein [Streptomyces sp. AC627_RSS907]
MTDLIDRLVMWVGLLFRPHGTHRRRAHPAVRPTPHHALATGIAPLPAHRSPYGLLFVLDGAETAAVRPYVVAHQPYTMSEAA